MATLARRRSENVDGLFYVDDTCIDCDTCRWVAPESFDRAGDKSRVHRQPVDAEDERRALMALVACPTSSIGTTERRAPPSEAFPEEIVDGIFHCGYHAEASFGATSYLVVRPRGNVLVDSPRFAGPLVRRIEELGGVRWMFLTHKDDVADHEKFRERFGCERILHAGDGIVDVERSITGVDTLRLDDDLLVIPTPGHTEGSACLLYQDRYLFSGDHVMWSPTRNRIHAPRSVCWYSWEELKRSVEKLADHRFEWILPGHGRRCRFEPDEMQAQLRRCREAMD